MLDASVEGDSLEGSMLSPSGQGILKVHLIQQDFADSFPICPWSRGSKSLFAAKAGGVTNAWYDLLFSSITLIWKSPASGSPGCPDPKQQGWEKPESLEMRYLLTWQATRLSQKFFNAWTSRNPLSKEALSSSKRSRRLEAPQKAWL